MRNRRLDVLRCIAVLLVIGRHDYPGTRLGEAGWVGVDLFFVLSGFLISGLLFSEYRKTGSIDFKRFFIRRGFKLYPAFYLLLIATFAVQSRASGLSTFKQYISEALYIQNYGAYIWDHTWSLAVEEHFYILLPLILLILIRILPNRKDPFRSLPAVFGFVSFACLAFRFLEIRQLPVNQLYKWPVIRSTHVDTHNRIDALFFGVLLGYFYYFKPQILIRLTESKGKIAALLLLSCTIISLPLFVPLGSRFMLTIGLSLMYVGFGTLLILSLHLNNVTPTFMRSGFFLIGRSLAFVGMYSYSIYLWHIPVITWGSGAVRAATGFRIRGAEQRLFSLVASIVFGIIMSRLVEYPMLRVRDRLFPTRSTKNISAPLSVPVAEQVQLSS